jgi:hypothetical protein
VQTQICALTWDGTTTETKCFTRGVISFTVGGKQVASGLDLGIQRLKVGDKAAIICAPFQAYGEPGNPPTVQPNSYVVFFVYIISCSDVGSELTTAVGPKELIGTGITTKFEEVLREINKENGADAEGAGAGAGANGSQVISDDMLSQAAASMGINSPPPPPPRNR